MRITATTSMLTIKEAAELVGVSDQSIRRWIKAGDLHAYKPGKEYRIDRKELWEFLDSRRAENPKAQAPSLRQQLEEAGCDTTGLRYIVLPEEEWVAAWSVEEPSDLAEHTVRLARAVQEEVQQVRPRVNEYQREQRRLNPRTPRIRLPASQLWSTIERRYEKAYHDALKALEHTEDPTDGGRFPSITDSGHKRAISDSDSPPASDPGPGQRWRKVGIGYATEFVGMSNAELEMLRDLAEEELLRRRSHA